MNLLPGKPRARGHAELTLYVVGRVEQHASRRRAVTSGPACLLEIVLQRTGDVGVDHQPNVRLVDAHAEGVGRRDRAKLAADEAPLDVLLGLGRQARVIVLGRHVLQLKELGHILALPARCAIDDGAAGSVGRQIGLQNLMDVTELLAACGRHHLEGQVAALGPAVEDRELDADLVPEVLRDVVGDVRLGGCRQAKHRRHRLITGLFPDEASDITVVGTEIVAPARQAVGLVEHPAADLALVQSPAKGAGAELLRRDEKDACVPEAHPVQRIGPLGHRQ